MEGQALQPLILLGQCAENRAFGVRVAPAVFRQMRRRVSHISQFVDALVQLGEMRLREPIHQCSCRASCCNERGSDWSSLWTFRLWEGQARIDECFAAQHYGQ